jgi:ssDNA-binding replication factor A large subunit
MSESISTLIEKIASEADISEDALKTKIEEKMKSLGNLISEEGAIHIIANELGVALHTTPQAEQKIEDLTPHMKSATFLAKVVKKYEVRTFGEGGKVGNLYVGDDTGFTRLTFWNDKTKYLEGINEGDVLLIQNAYMKENNDRLEVHMGNSAHCIVNPDGRDVQLKERSAPPTAPEKKLNEITDDDNMVAITATVVQLYDPRFFESCPVCNKRMREEDGSFACAEHGEQEPNFNYVMNIYLDDGSDNMRATLWKEQVQRLFGKSDSEVVAIKDNSAALEDLKNDCLGKIITARAKVKLNEAYQQKELVLYDVQAPASTVSTPQAAPAEKKATAPEKKPESSVSEEVFTDDDEDLLSIDDLEEEL